MLGNLNGMARMGDTNWEDLLKSVTGTAGQAYRDTLNAQLAARGQSLPIQYQQNTSPLSNTLLVGGGLLLGGVVLFSLLRKR